jgi:hypothetical protein
MKALVVELGLSLDDQAVLETAITRLVTRNQVRSGA